MDSDGFAASAYTTILCWDNSGQSVIYACSSTRELKANEKIIDFNVTKFLLQLKPKTYNVRDERTKEITTQSNIGLIAEDVYDISKGTEFEKLIQWNVNETSGEKKVQGIDYQGGISSLLIKGFQEQQTEIEKIKQQNADLKSALCEIKPDLELCRK